MHIAIHFLLQVAASVCGILVGAFIARIWDETWRKMKYRKKRR